jgi:hypothetical protein
MALAAYERRAANLSDGFTPQEIAFASGSFRILVVFDSSRPSRAADIPFTDAPV